VAAKADRDRNIQKHPNRSPVTRSHQNRQRRSAESVLRANTNSPSSQLCG